MKNNELFLGIFQILITFATWEILGLTRGTLLGPLIIFVYQFSFVRLSTGYPALTRILSYSFTLATKYKGLI